MELQVLVEPDAQGGFLATTALAGSGPTAEAAVEALRVRLRAAAEAVLVVVPPIERPRPLAPFAGMFRDDPDFAEVVADIARWRDAEAIGPMSQERWSVFPLDTDTLTLFQHGNAAVVAGCLACPPEKLALSIITVEEQTRGWQARVARAANPTETARAYASWTRFLEMLPSFRIVSFTEAAVVRFENLKRSKLFVKPMDLRIAAIALEANAVVVTRNRRDFERVPGVAQVDWSK